VAGEIVRSDVGFRFDNLPGEIPAPEPADQNFTEKVFCYLEGGSAVELVSEFHSDSGIQCQSGLPLKKEATVVDTVASR
jgi:hypothetical protein